MLDRLFDKALRIGGNTYTRDDVVAKIRAGEFHCFHNDKAVVIASVHDAPQKRFLHVFAVAGDWDSVVALQDELEGFARANGCQYMTTTGRKGFLRTLPKIGWFPVAVTFRKELAHG